MTRVFKWRSFTGNSWLKKGIFIVEKKKNLKEIYLESTYQITIEIIVLLFNFVCHIKYFFLFCPLDWYLQSQKKVYTPVYHHTYIQPRRLTETVLLYKLRLCWEIRRRRVNKRKLVEFPRQKGELRILHQRLQWCDLEPEGGY